MIASNPERIHPLFATALAWTVALVAAATVLALVASGAPGSLGLVATRAIRPAFAFIAASAFVCANRAGHYIELQGKVVSVSNTVMATQTGFI
jgi:hypothetical protein